MLQLIRSISLFQEHEIPKSIYETFWPKADIRIAEPIDIQIDEVGSNIVQMYQAIVIMHDGKVLGLESIATMSQPSTNTIITLPKTIRSVFRISCLFLRPRLWQFEIRDSTDK